MDTISQATAEAQGPKGTRGALASGTEEVKYRVVADDEIKLLVPLFAKLGWPLPDPQFAKVVVAEAGLGRDAVILGFEVVQFVLHAEPMWIHASARGSGVAEGLVAQTAHYIEHDCHMDRYVVTVKENSFAARLAEQHGMTKVPGACVYQKVIPRSKEN